MKTILKISMFLGLLSGLARAQFVPFQSQFPWTAYAFAGTHAVSGGWGTPDFNIPIVGAGAYCSNNQSLIGVTMGPQTVCSETISMKTQGGKDPGAWILYTLGTNWAINYQYFTRQWYYWTSCDTNGAMHLSYDSPLGIRNGMWYPESC